MEYAVHLSCARNPSTCWRVKECVVVVCVADAVVDEDVAIVVDAAAHAKDEITAPPQC